MFVYIHILSYYKLFLHFNFCPSVKLDSLSCSFTSIFFLNTSCPFTLIIPPLPEGGGRYTILPLSVCPSVLPSVRPSFRPSKIFFVAFFSVTVDDRNLIFVHKLHIGTHIVGRVFGPIRFLLPVCRLS